MYPYVRNNFKVVEINNVVGLRSGHIIAQTPLYNTVGTAYADATIVENGKILYLGVDRFYAPTNLPAGLPRLPILHYTEELFTGPLAELKEFAVEFEDGVAYPRGIVLNIGDTYTTNSFDGAFNEDAIYATVDGAGLLVPATTVIATAYNGPLFALKASTLPDGINDAYEVTYLGNIIVVVA